MKGAIFSKSPFSLIKVINNYNNYIMFMLLKKREKKQEYIKYNYGRRINWLIAATPMGVLPWACWSEGK